MSALFRARLARLRYLDLRLPLRRGLAVRIVERPGLWMDDAGHEQLLTEMRAVVARSLAASLSYGAVCGSPERLRHAIVTLLYDTQSARAVAFNAISVVPLELHGRRTEVIHLGLAMVDPQFRGRGLLSTLYQLPAALILIRAALRPIWITNVTQVPAVFGKVAEICRAVWPNPLQPSRRSAAHLQIARELMARHRHVFGVGSDATFDEERFVVINAYTGGSDNLKKSFEEAPKHRDARVNLRCSRELDYARGDDFLQVARFDLLSIGRYALSSLRGSR